MTSFDPRLITAMKNGDDAALGQFYRAHARVVLSWVIRLGGPHMDAEDVAQEIFMIALRKIHTFRGDAKVTTWLFLSLEMLSTIDVENSRYDVLLAWNV